MLMKLRVVKKNSDCQLNNAIIRIKVIRRPIRVQLSCFLNAEIIGLHRCGLTVA